MDANNTRTSGPMWNLHARSFHIRFIYPPSIKKVKQKILKKYINNPLFKYQLTISIKSSNVKPAQFELLWTKMFQSRDQAKYVVFCLFFSVRLLSVLRGHSVFSSPPQRPMTSDFEGFSIPDLIHYIIFLSKFLRKSQYFPFQC